jgi:hypothetical protein
MSRFPILSSTYLKFTLAGKPLKIFQGDYYVGKGAGVVCIDHPDIGLVDVYTTHVSKLCPCSDENHVFIIAVVAGRIWR